MNRDKGKAIVNTVSNVLVDGIGGGALGGAIASIAKPYFPSGTVFGTVMTVGGILASFGVGMYAGHIAGNEISELGNTIVDAICDITDACREGKSKVAEA